MGSALPGSRAFAAFCLVALAMLFLLWTRSESPWTLLFVGLPAATTALLCWRQRTWPAVLATIFGATLAVSVTILAKAWMDAPYDGDYRGLGVLLAAVWGAVSGGLALMVASLLVSFGTEGARD